MSWAVVGGRPSTSHICIARLAGPANMPNRRDCSSRSLACRSPPVKEGSEMSGMSTLCAVSTARSRSASWRSRASWVPKEPQSWASSGSSAWSRTWPSQVPALLASHSISAVQRPAKACNPSWPQATARFQSRTSFPRERTEACRSASRENRSATSDAVGIAVSAGRSRAQASARLTPTWRISPVNSASSPPLTGARVATAMTSSMQPSVDA